MKSLSIFLALCLAFYDTSISAAATQLDVKSLDSLGLVDGQQIELDLSVNQRFQIAGDIEIEGVKHHIQLFPHSVRSDNFVLRVQRQDGTLVKEHTESRTVRGVISSLPGSRIVGSVLENGLSAKIIMPEGQEFFIEPLSGRLENAEIGQHIIYSRTDVKPHGKTCGVQQGDIENFEVSDFIEQPYFGNGNQVSIAELALDADFEYFQTYGTTQATMDRMENIINIINNQYENQVAITHQLTDVIIRQNSNDPYSSSNAETLLNQFRSEWLNNQGSIQRDVAHLFTGKSINGGTIGVAWLGAICNTNFHYGLSESDFNNNLGCATDLTAHELGHNWDSDHCNCSSFTMNPSITCANNFSQGTINTIIAFRDSLNCLDTGTGGGTPPANDDWANKINLGSTFPINTTGTNIAATTETGEQQLTNAGATVWWFCTSPGDGTITIDTFGSDYDTQLHIYDGFAPEITLADLNPVANNDDAPGAPAGNQFVSKVSFAATGGTCYEIRVGGYQGSGAASQGNIVINGTFVPDEQILIGDVNCDGLINLLDIGPFVDVVSEGIFDVKADINEDGLVNLLDIGPFVELLSN